MTDDDLIERCEDDSSRPSAQQQTGATLWHTRMHACTRASQTVSMNVFFSQSVSQYCTGQSAVFSETMLHSVEWDAISACTCVWCWQSSDSAECTLNCCTLSSTLNCTLSGTVTDSKMKMRNKQTSTVSVHKQLPRETNNDVFYDKQLHIPCHSHGHENLLAKILHPLQFLDYFSAVHFLQLGVLIRTGRCEIGKLFSSN